MAGLKTVFGMFGLLLLFMVLLIIVDQTPRFQFSHIDSLPAGWKKCTTLLKYSDACKLKQLIQKVILQIFFVYVFELGFFALCISMPKFLIQSPTV